MCVRLGVYMCAVCGIHSCTCAPCTCVCLGVCLCEYVGICVRTHSLGSRGAGRALKRKEGKEQGDTMKGRNKRQTDQQTEVEKPRPPQDSSSMPPPVGNTSRGHRSYLYSPCGAMSSEVT